MSNKMQRITLWGVPYQLIGVIDSNILRLENLETGEIESKHVADLKKEVLISKDEIDKRTHFFEYLKIMEEKRDNKELFSAYDEFGPFLMQMLGAKKPRDKDDVKRVVKGITIVQEGYLIDMLTNFLEHTGKPLKIKINRKGNKEILANKHLEQRYNLSKGQISKTLSAIKKANILINKKEEKGLFINPKFFKRRTEAKGEYVVRVYQEKMKEIIENLKVLLDDMTDVYACLGLLNRLGYSFHHSTFHLCSNPDEPICKEGETVTDVLLDRPEVIDYFGTRELLRLVSDGEKEAFIETLEYRISALMAAGAIMRKSTLANIYLIHPELMNRRFSEEALECEHKKHVIKDFKILEVASKKEFNKLKRKRKTQLKKSKAAKIKTIEKQDKESSE